MLKKSVSLVISVLKQEFSVCKVRDYSQIDLSAAFVFTGSTDEEQSLVCPIVMVPDDTVERSDGWRAFRIEGVLDFSMVGILSGISSLLASNGIGIFAISTFNTDYILTRSTDLDKATGILSRAGYNIKQPE